MKHLLLSLLFIGTISFSQKTSFKIDVKTQSKVYVCVSSGAYAYHYTRDCKGLNRCTHTIKAVTETEAINTYNRKKCKVCY